jgi:hypothetical protein
MIEGNREPTARTAIVRKAYAVFRIRHRNASELAQFRLFGDCIWIFPQQNPRQSRRAREILANE